MHDLAIPGMLRSKLLRTATKLQMNKRSTVWLQLFSRAFGIWKWMGGAPLGDLFLGFRKVGALLGLS